MPVTTTETPESTSTAPTPTTARESDSEAPSNISGLCDPSLQPRIDEALSGIGDFGALIADAEPKLWDLAAVLPIVQDRTLAALGTGVEGVTLTSPVQVGIFGDATNWVRVKE